MGNIQTLGIISSRAVVGEKLTRKAFESKYLDTEPVEWVEERCCNLKNPLRLLGAQHSFVVLRTYTGKCVRLEYCQDTPRGEVVYDYIDFLPSELFRRAKARRGMTVGGAVNLFVEKASKKNYDLKEHSCQHVSRDTYNAVSGQREIQLRISWLEWLLERIKVAVPKDPLHDTIQQEEELKGDFEEDEETDISRLIIDFFFLDKKVF